MPLAHAPFLPGPIPPPLPPRDDVIMQTLPLLSPVGLMTQMHVMRPHTHADAHRHMRSHSHLNCHRVAKKLEALGGFNVVTPRAYVDTFIRNVKPNPASCPTPSGSYTASCRCVCVFIFVCACMSCLRACLLACMPACMPACIPACIYLPAYLPASVHVKIHV